MDVVIIVTLSEISNRWDWDKYCEITGTNPWCLNEGLATGDERVELTTEQAYKIGIRLQ